MSEETINGCIRHKDTRHLRLYFDYIQIYKDGNKVNEHKAKLVRILEAWTDSKRADWYKKSMELREQGKPITEPDFWITMSFQQFRTFMYESASIDTIKANLDELIKMNHIQRRVNPDNPYGPPQYLLNCKVIQKALDKLDAQCFIPDIPTFSEDDPPLEEDTPPGKATPPTGVQNTPTQGGKPGGAPQENTPPGRGENTPPSKNGSKNTKNILENEGRKNPSVRPSTIPSIDADVQRIWNFYCQLEQFKRVKPKLNEDRAKQCKQLAPHVQSLEEMISLVEHARTILLAQKKDASTVYLGNLISTTVLNSWKKPGEKSHATGQSDLEHYPSVIPGYIDQAARNRAMREKYARKEA